MKRITIRKDERFPTCGLLKIVAEQSPNRALDLSEIRLRVKFLDVLAEIEANADHLIVEDEVHSMLANAVRTFPWQQAAPELLRVIDDVLEATPVSTASLKAV